MTPQQEGMERHEIFLWFPQTEPRSLPPAPPVSDHTPRAPPGELARQASLGGVPAPSPLISRSVSRWIHRGVIKAINKFPDGWIAGGLALAPAAPCIVRSSSGPHTPETMPRFLPGSHRPEPVSWARPRALAKPLSPSQTRPAVPMTRGMASSLPPKIGGPGAGGREPSLPTDAPIPTGPDQEVCCLSFEKEPPGLATLSAPN